MRRKPTPKKPQPLTAAIIAYMKPGEERGDGQCAGLRVRCLASGQKVFFYRYRGRDGALREIRLGQVGPLTLAKARDAALMKRLERDQGIDPQLEKRKQKEAAARARVAQRQAAYTLEDLVNEYIKEALKGQKRGAESARLLRQDLLPVLGHRPALQITRRELQDEVIRPRLAKAPPRAAGSAAAAAYPTPTSSDRIRGTSKRLEPRERGFLDDRFGEPRHAPTLRSRACARGAASRARISATTSSSAGASIRFLRRNARH